MHASVFVVIVFHIIIFYYLSASSKSFCRKTTLIITFHKFIPWSYTSCSRYRIKRSNSCVIWFKRRQFKFRIIYNRFRYILLRLRLRFRFKSNSSFIIKSKLRIRIWIFNRNIIFIISKFFVTKHLIPSFLIASKSFNTIRSYFSSFK